MLVDARDARLAFDRHLRLALLIICGPHSTLPTASRASWSGSLTGLPHTLQCAQVLLDEPDLHRPLWRLDDPIRVRLSDGLAEPRRPLREILGIGDEPIHVARRTIDRYTQCSRRKRHHHRSSPEEARMLEPLVAYLHYLSIIL